MKNIKYMNEEVVIKKAIEVLIKELGPVEAIRFINIPKREGMESIKRHRKWQQMLDKSMFFDDIFAE